PTAADKPAAKDAAINSGTNKTPATLVQFVQQDQPKQADENRRDRPSDDRRGRSGPGGGRGDASGRFGPGRGQGGRMGMRGGMGSRGYGSIVDVGSALLGLTPAGELIACQPQGDAYKELARYKVAEAGTYAYPVPAGNAIYIKEQDSVTMWSVE